jgi:hypothetical protein
MLLLLLLLLLLPCRALCTGRCKAARYCSKECQVDAWKLHKSTCKALQRKREQQQRQQ